MERQRARRSDGRWYQREGAELLAMVWYLEDGQKESKGEISKMDLSKLGEVGAFLYHSGAVGQSHPKTRRDVLLSKGLEDTPANRRKVSKWLEAERQETVIIGDSSGLYLPATREEVDKYVKLQSARAKGVFRTLKSARLLLKEMPGQIEMNMGTEGKEDAETQGGKEL